MPLDEAESVDEDAVAHQKVEIDNKVRSKNILRDLVVLIMLNVDRPRADTRYD